MNIKWLIKKHVFRQKSMAQKCSEYIETLRRKGVKIGEGTIVNDYRDILIDYSRPELVEIGKHVFLHSGTKILTHDWASWCFVESDDKFYPSHAKVTLGNNIWLGENVTICKGVSIGDNCIIGIGSIVTKPIPSGSVAVGVPAKVVGTYQDYMKKRSKLYVDEAIEYANAILDSGREPLVEDFYDDYPCFVDRTNYKEYNYPYDRVFAPPSFDSWLKTHNKVFDGFDEFISYVKQRRNEKR